MWRTYRFLSTRAQAQDWEIIIGRRWWWTATRVDFLFDTRCLASIFHHWHLKTRKTTEWDTLKGLSWHEIKFALLKMESTTTERKSKSKRFIHQWRADVTISFHSDKGFRMPNLWKFFWILKFPHKKRETRMKSRVQKRRKNYYVTFVWNRINFQFRFLSIRVVLLVLFLMQMEFFFLSREWKWTKKKPRRSIEMIPKVVLKRPRRACVLNRAMLPMFHVRYSMLIKPEGYNVVAVRPFQFTIYSCTQEFKFDGNEEC